MRAPAAGVLNSGVADSLVDGSSRAGRVADGAQRKWSMEHREDDERIELARISFEHQVWVLKRIWSM